MGGIVAKAAKRESAAVTVNAVVRFVAYVTLEERKGPTALPRYLAELSIPIFNPFLGSLLLVPLNRYEGPGE